jgi:hypothetical protein
LIRYNTSEVCRVNAISKHEKVIKYLKDKSRKDAFDKIFSMKLWGATEESVSGNGSSRYYTTNVRKLLERALQMLGITSMVDAPCGDTNWQPLLKGFTEISYIGIDIVPSLIKNNTEKFKNHTNMIFLEKDISTEALPKADLALCRDMIQHNSLEDGYRTFMNIENSGIKYLVTNFHLYSKENINIIPGEWYPIDVFLPPFNFSKPLFFTKEGHDGDSVDGKMVGIWKLPALGMGNGKKLDIDATIVEASKKTLVHVVDNKFQIVM